MAEHFINSYQNNSDDLLSLSVYNVGFQKCHPLCQWGPGIRDHYILYYVISGAGSYSINGKEYSIQSGDTFLVYPNTKVWYRADPENPWEFYWVGFQGKHIDSILSSTDFTLERPVCTASFGDELEHLLLDLYEVRGSDLADKLKRSAVLSSVLSLFIRYARSNRPRKNCGQVYIQKVIEYIAHNYSNSINVSEIAGEVGISRSHLYRLFKQYIGMPLNVYLTQFRIAQSICLLETTDLTISAVAASVGFESPLYFSRVFRREKGVSPREYVKDFYNNCPLDGQCCMF